VKGVKGFLLHSKTTNIQSFQTVIAVCETAIHDLHGFVIR